MMDTETVHIKKRLIKPPEKNGELLFIPGIKEFLSRLDGYSRVGVCHQPHFFNPGVSVKFVLLDEVPVKNKGFLFLDTERTRIDVNIPLPDGTTKPVIFMDSDQVLSDRPMPDKQTFFRCCSTIEHELREAFPRDSQGALSNFMAFKDILMSNANKSLLKEALAESFMRYYGIEHQYQFVSDIIKCKEYRELFRRIYKDSDEFIDIFNRAIDDYAKVFKFRFNNYPFPKLEKDELPFWLIQGARRSKCFKSYMASSDVEKFTIFPRAVTLTIFLRLYKYDYLIHGTGGANYEWIQDQVITRFFRRDPPPYLVASGTWRLKETCSREMSYFLFKSAPIRDKIILSFPPLLAQG